MAVFAVEECQAPAACVAFLMAPLRSEQGPQRFETQVERVEQGGRAEECGRALRLIPGRIDVRWCCLRQFQRPGGALQVGCRGRIGMIWKITAKEACRGTGVRCQAYT